MKIEMLKEIAKKIRRSIIDTTYLAGSGHPGGSLSAVELLVYLYFYKMRYDPKNPGWEERDRFVLSKGHATPLIYSVLAYAGFFPEDDLKHFRKLGSHLQGHPSHLDTPGIEASTGSLGMGLSIANGIALAGKMDKKDYRVYVLLGDGEIEEGQIWEASMTSSRYKLDNLTAILDNNNLQIDGKVSDIKNPYPLKDKWLSFGWEVFSIDGHSFEEIHDAFTASENVKDKPKMIIAKTIKGKGVSFMENNYEWHGKAPKEEERLKALKELS
uniref:Transketolase n=1 Tax=candidate division WOR-3 bacterium TaxID=2052148 RepID=A0A7C4YS63_UNCW3